jgi:hypothetical protein
VFTTAVTLAAVVNPPPERVTFAVVYPAPGLVITIDETVLPRTIAVAVAVVVFAPPIDTVGVDV